MAAKQQHAVGLTCAHQVDIARLLFGRAGQVGDDEPIAGGRQRVVDALQNFGKKRIGDVGHRHQHHHGLADAQVPRGDVRRVAGVAYRGEHADAGFLGHQFGPRQRTADGRDRDAGKLRDVRDLGRRLAYPLGSLCHLEVRTIAAATALQNAEVVIASNVIDYIGL